MVPQLYRLLNFCVFQLLNRFHEAGTNPFECVSMFESRSRWRKNQIIIIAREAGNLLCDDVKFLWHTRTKKAQKQKKNGKARKTKQNTKQMYLELKSIDYLELSGQEIRTRCVHISSNWFEILSASEFISIWCNSILHDFSMEKSTAFFGLTTQYFSANAFTFYKLILCITFGSSIFHFYILISLRIHNIFKNSMVFEKCACASLNTQQNQIHLIHSTIFNENA